LSKNKQYIVELLQEYGMISEEQVKEAAKKSNESDGKLDIIEAMKELKFIQDSELTAMLAQQYGLDVLDLQSYQIPSEVIETLTPEIVRQYRVVPVMKHDDVLTIAMSDPADMETIDSLRYLLGCDVDAVVSSQEQIDKIIAQHYSSLSDSVESFIDELSTEQQLQGQLMAGLAGAEAAAEVEDDAPIIKLVSLIIIEAYRMRASDIHMEPLEKRYRIRYRVDGALREVEAPPKYLQANLTSRLKIMARLDISEKRVPQDGRIQLKIVDKDIDLRVSSIPTTHGESIVMRILDKASIQLDIPKLGFYADDLEVVNSVLALPDGIFLVTGPTGSGKTTSLYAFLNTINTPNRKIITVEDPVEYLLAGINQVQVDKQINFTFAAALRSMLRQAPNIIMVGEIRDYETAEIAINASLTGHLVFSTLHTNDAPGAVTRLIDMGVKPFLVASAVRAIMAQRLLRRICKNCSAPYTPTPTEVRLLGLSEEYLQTRQFCRGTGCEVCGGTGYKGRIGIYEIFKLSTEIANLVFNNVSTGVIREAARRGGMRSLRDDALRKAEAGTTTLDEVIKATMMDEE
jgi:general secretion pathway protein E/type IV pilus assembly protein PilB